MVYDEEPDERRREKFSRERGVGQQDFRRPFDRSRRADFSANGTMKRSFRGSGLEDEQQPLKRGRFDSASDSYEPIFNKRDTAQDSDGGTTTLLTFRKFLATQDESLSDEEAVTKYNEYKFDVLRQECERFFQKHKEEEWFRFKYHPEDGRAGREEHRSNIQKRLAVFNEFFEKSIFDNVPLDFAHSERIIRIMDAVIVKLEGGTNADIDAIKDEPIEDESIQDLLKEKDSEKGKVPETTDGAVNVPISSEGEQSPKQQKTSDEEGSATAAEETVADVKSVATLQQHQLHKTCSVHFRTVPANAPIADLENLCKQHPGFLRLAIGDPVTDSRGVRLRPAWATYRRDVNIREIYWALRRAKLMTSDLGTQVNRDLKRRIRVSGDFVPSVATLSAFTSAIDSHRPIASNTLRQAARLIFLLDVREGLYREEAEDGEDEGGRSFDMGEFNGVDGLDEAVLKSRNPILAGIADYMVEEASVEEEVLLERAASVDGTIASSEISLQFEEDRSLLKILDRLLFYLRIVHSVDFYGAVHYPQEDRMPSRLGLFHVRRIPPAIENTKRAPQLSKSAVDGHIEGFNARLENGLFKRCTPLSERDLQKLDKKDADKAVELFVNANTQQLGPEKWLCPLSGKKFKGPEFVHKHIHSKYNEEVDKMRNEALYYNNFITDPNRPHSPQLFEQPKTRAESRQLIESGTDTQHVSPHMESTNERIPFQRGTSSWGGGNYGADRVGGPSRYSGVSRPPMNSGGWRRMEPMNETTVRGVNGGGGGMRDPRAPPSYRDLDAPTEDII
ncbi:hypothetical protein niasHT_007308 [Heterodera trifolii]|uniref:Serrate RNA effector molecule homolog n=1 Tax=Heterodera trifolii TaxID=157864 RepID=A0ABD2LLL1_9BILA